MVGALVVVLLCTVIGALLGYTLIGLAVGLLIVLLSSITP